MGGCRCSYRSCSLRSDGRTHMFHYPVFDKVRCHQWLTNAQKLEFLNLKVSQLKNRVVCQHHFRDENFMNFKKDKLTFDAVPTEDGPYCDSSQLTEDLTEPDVGKVYCITLDDIENEYMTLSDKKANFTVKYGDFLTNGELMDLDTLNHNSNTQIARKRKVEEPASIILNNNIDRKPYSNIATLVDIKPRDIRRWMEDGVDGKMKEGDVNPSIIPIQFEDILRPTKPQNSYQGANVKKLNDIDPQMENTSKSLQKDKKIRIISEQRISKPVPLIGKLEPLSPSTVLPLPKKQRIIKTNVVEPNDIKDAMIEISIDNIIQNNIEKPDNKHVIETSQEEPKPSPLPIIKSNNVRNKDKIEIRTPTSLLKSKSKIPQVSPERVAAIEQKRKFNMKLRDIIETCLDKIDDQEKISENTKYLQNFKSKVVHPQQQVASYLSTEPNLPHINEYAITYLEDKMKKMEQNLIQKICQNSYRIMDLKQSFSTPAVKKTVQTQTPVTEELDKKHLYQEISKYLSPDANNLIYEELFINKYVQNVPKILPSGKRKRKYR